ncbi:MAG: hypothetical protein V4710_04185 [Verrucomicrobiota bacterium]
MKFICKADGRRRDGASALVAALGLVFVLSVATVYTISRITTQYHAGFQSASWEEAFRASEAGADLVMANLNQLPNNPTGAWVGWSAPDATGRRTRHYSATSNPPLVVHAGEGNTKLYASVQADPIAIGNRTWFRIRATGIAEVPGGKRITTEASLRSVSGKKNHRSILRRIRFHTDSTGGALKLPQMSRTVELVAQPTPARLFQRALTVQNTVGMSGGAYTDSFDSTNPARSTNGLYDPLKRGSKGTVATNTAGEYSDLGNCMVWGDAMSNGGSMENISGVKGSLVNNFQTELPPVSPPQWTSMIPTPNVITGNQTLLAGSQAAPSRYKVNFIELKSSDSLTLVNPTPGQPAYIEIWCLGDMKTNAQAQFTIQDGVVAKFFVEGDFTIGGGGVNNQSSRAANLILYGVTPANGTPRSFKLAGSADFTGVIYCPGFDFTCVGGGNFQGAIIAKTARVTGNAGYHYDEMLGLVDSDTVGGYQMASWIEDTQ